MSLYYYVKIKDDLIAAMDDALMGDALLPSLPKDLAACDDGDRQTNARSLGSARCATQSNVSKRLLKHQWCRVPAMDSNQGSPNSVADPNFLTFAAFHPHVGSAALDLESIYL